MSACACVPVVVRVQHDALVVAPGELLPLPGAQLRRAVARYEQLQPRRCQIILNIKGPLAHCHMAYLHIYK